METAARVAERYGPWVVRGTDDLLVDVTGTAHLFGGEPAMLEDCRERVRGARMVGAGGGGGAGSARRWGLARFAGPRPHRRNSPEEVHETPGRSPSPRCRERGEAAPGRVAAHRRPCEPFLERPSPNGSARGWCGTSGRLLGDEVGAGREPLGARPSAPGGCAKAGKGLEPLRDPSIGRSGLRPALLRESVLPAPPGGSRGARRWSSSSNSMPRAPEPRRVEVRAGRGLRDRPNGGSPSFGSAPRRSIRPSGVIRLELAAAAVGALRPRGSAPTGKHCGSVSRPGSGPATWCGFSPFRRYIGRRRHANVEPVLGLRVSAAFPGRPPIRGFATPGPLASDRRVR